MRLLNEDTNRPVDRAWLYLQVDEARVLYEQLRGYFDSEDDQPDWHCHVVSSDGLPKELTVAVYLPDRLSSGPDWQAWLLKDEWSPELFSPPTST